MCRAYCHRNHRPRPDRDPPYDQQCSQPNALNKVHVQPRSGKHTGKIVRIPLCHTHYRRLHRDGFVKVIYDEQIVFVKIPELKATRNGNTE